MTAIPEGMVLVGEMKSEHFLTYVHWNVDVPKGTKLYAVIPGELAAQQVELGRASGTAGLREWLSGPEGQAGIANIKRQMAEYKEKTGKARSLTWEELNEHVFYLSSNTERDDRHAAIALRSSWPVVAPLVEAALDVADSCGRAVKDGADGPYGDAYQGAREDLAIWKKRALEAEEQNRQLSRALAEEVNGPTFMGEPSLPPAIPSVPKGDNDGE